MCCGSHATAIRFSPEGVGRAPRAGAQGREGAAGPVKSGHGRPREKQPELMPAEADQADPAGAR